MTPPPRSLIPPVGLLAWLLPGLALAQDTAADATARLPSFGTLLLQTLVSLALVCLLAWLLIRFGLTRLQKPPSPDRSLQILETLPLGGRRSILLLRARDRVLVVGSTEAGLHLLTDLGQGSALEPPPTPAHFADALLEARHLPPQAEDPHNPAPREPTP